ncbi:MAG: hypothetical protein AAB937_00530 [Patescibacteria group bacterium]
MNDILNPVINEKKYKQKNSEVVYTASAKPSKELSHLNIKVAQPIDLLLNGLQTYNTIDTPSINTLTKQLENVKNSLDSTKKTQVEQSLSSLKNEMDSLEVIEVKDALSTIDSPWGTVAQKIADSNRLKQVLPDKKLREQYVDKLLFPLGAELFREIRSMTQDPLTRQLMFHSIADEIQNKPDIIQIAKESIPKPKDTGTVKNLMRPVSIQLLGFKYDGHHTDTQIEALYKKSIHTAVLKSRLSAEQTIFDLSNMEQTLRTQQIDVDQTFIPFAKEHAAQTLRENQSEYNDMKRIRHIIDQQLPSVHDETSLMNALDNVQKARFEDSNEEIAPYKLEPWVPEAIRQDARSTLELLSQPKEDLYAKLMKKLDATDRRFKSQETTWSETKYKDHMKWLADPLAQANRNKRIINIIDLVITLTTLVSGVTGNIQRQIEGNYSTGMTINDYIDYVESQRPWEAAADLATPKLPKSKIGQQSI